MGLSCHCGGACGACSAPVFNSCPVRPSPGATGAPNLGGTRSTPLLSGEAGIAQTIAFMKLLIDQGVKDPRVNEFAITALRQFGVDGFDEAAKARTLFDILKPGGYGGYVYIPNPASPLGQRETLREARTFLRVGGGDCKNFTVAICAVLGTVGIKTRLVTVASDPNYPDEFSHVYPEAEIDGAWIPVDAARPDREFGLAPRRVYRKKIWPSEISGELPRGGETLSGVHHSLAGYHHLPAGPHPLGAYAERMPRRRSLSGMGRGLGQSANDIAQDITAAATGTADIILSTEASPYNIYGTVATIPGQTQLSAVGYSSGLGTTTISPTLILLGLGLLAVLMVAKR